MLCWTWWFVPSEANADTIRIIDQEAVSDSAIRTVLRYLLSIWTMIWRSQLLPSDRLRRSTMVSHSPNTKKTRIKQPSGSKNVVLSTIRAMVGKYLYHILESI